MEVEGSCQMGALMLTVIRPSSICQLFMVYGSGSGSSKLILLCLVQTTVRQTTEWLPKGQSNFNITSLSKLDKFLPK